ncbi:MAG: hypothetical protein QOJ71_1407, partial [Actinomycetota bacterium]|nr:hypothetical protein [Actinomycetota bacterium]
MLFDQWYLTLVCLLITWGEAVLGSRVVNPQYKANAALIVLSPEEPARNRSEPKNRGTRRARGLGSPRRLGDRHDASVRGMTVVAIVALAAGTASCSSGGGKVTVGASSTAAVTTSSTTAAVSTSKVACTFFDSATAYRCTPARGVAE